MSEFPLYLDVAFKIVAILLSGVAIFQLLEARKKRHIDMYWKIYEMYTSETQKKARKDTVELRNIFQDKIESGVSEVDIRQFYSDQYHRTKNEDKKTIDRSIVNRIRFINLTGRLLEMNLVNKDMLFDLIGIGYEHDYNFLKIVLESHRIDHNTPQMYGTFENVNDHYKEWKKDKNYYFGNRNDSF